MIQVLLYSFGAALTTAMWFEASWIYAICVAAVIGTSNALLWHLAHIPIRHIAYRRQSDSYSLAKHICPVCTSDKVELTSEMVIVCHDCDTKWRIDEEDGLVSRRFK